MTTGSPSETSLPESSTPTGPTSDDVLRPVGEINARFVRRFREQVHALGGVWIVLGGLQVALLFMPAKVLALLGAEQPWLMVNAGLGLAWVALGAYALQKNLRALKIGLVLCFAVLAANVVSWISLAFQIQASPGVVSALSNMAILRLMIWVYVMLQCRRVVRWAKQMHEAGIPLTTLPVRRKA